MMEYDELTFSEQVKLHIESLKEEYRQELYGLLDMDIVNSHLVDGILDVKFLYRNEDFNVEVKQIVRELTLNIKEKINKYIMHTSQ